MKKINTVFHPLSTGPRRRLPFGPRPIHQRGRVRVRILYIPEDFLFWRYRGLCAHVLSDGKRTTQRVRTLPSVCSVPAKFSTRFPCGKDAPVTHHLKTCESRFCLITLVACKTRSKFVVFLQMRSPVLREHDLTIKGGVSPDFIKSHGTYL